MRSTLMFGAGRNSYCVTTGPGVVPTTSTGTLNWPSVSTKISAVLSMSPWSAVPLGIGLSSESGGNG